MDPRRNLAQPPLQALDFGQAHVRQRRHGVPIQTAQRDLVKVDQADLGHAGPRKGGGGVAAHAAAADDDDKGRAEGVEAGRGEEDAVAGELLEDELGVEVAGLGAAGERFGAQVFLVGGGDGAEGGELFFRMEAVSDQRLFE